MYQLIIWLPQNIVTNIPKIKNGANGIWLFNPTTLPPKDILEKIEIKPIIAPKKKLKNKPIKILGKPNKRPNKTTNLQSPKPIHSPFDIKNIIQKNKNDINPAQK